jgi:hypothetical protein
MFIGARTLSGISLVLLAGLEVGALASGHVTPLTTAATWLSPGLLPQAAAAERAHTMDSIVMENALELQQTLTRRLAATPREDTAVLDAQLADRVMRIESWFYRTATTVSVSPAHHRAAEAWADYRAALAEALALARQGNMTEVRVAAVGVDTEFRRFVVALAIDD